MSQGTNVGLAAVAFLWWIAVGWYAWRLLVPWRLRVRGRHVQLYRTRIRVRRSVTTWHLIVMGVVVASFATEELIMQRLVGGWRWHEEFIGFVVLAIILLGADRLRLLWETRPIEAELANDI
ncbi:hypothetical protein [Georgenia faecalis]|uniref:hypothetical protein n=1 Tax=Georgenia faecalis TaxID=2483799 RepID=UPI000FDBE84D|nr:hypothetical protein [Georgenia faecalis]